MSGQESFCFSTLPHHPAGRRQTCRTRLSVDKSIEATTPHGPATWLASCVLAVARRFECSEVARTAYGACASDRRSVGAWTERAPNHRGREGVKSSAYRGSATLRRGTCEVLALALGRAAWPCREPKTLKCVHMGSCRLAERVRLVQSRSLSGVLAWLDMSSRDVHLARVTPPHCVSRRACLYVLACVLTQHLFNLFRSSLRARTVPRRYLLSTDHLRSRHLDFSRVRRLFEVFRQRAKMGFKLLEALQLCVHTINFSLAILHMLQ